jgi:hypothetical protein
MGLRADFPTDSRAILDHGNALASKGDRREGGEKNWAGDAGPSLVLLREGRTPDENLHPSGSMPERGARNCDLAHNQKNSGMLCFAT